MVECFSKLDSQGARASLAHNYGGAELLPVVSKGFGRHIETLGSNATYDFMLCMFIGDLFCPLVIILVKYSILALYMRLFGHTSVETLIWIIAAIVTSWGLATVLHDK